MLAQWIGDLVGKMHKHRISMKMLADHMNLSREYVSMVLNGHRDPNGAEEKFTNAVNEIIESMS